MPDFAKVMNYPDKKDELFIFDFSKGYDPDFIRSKEWGIGRYNEKRFEMYVAPQYKSERDIHIGIDIWTEAGAPVFSFYEGRVVYLQDNNQPGDYGPTMVIQYELDDAKIFALYRHLTRNSIRRMTVGQQVLRGEKIAELGSAEVNGGWAPHLHFQLSIEDPGEADMLGVVSDKNREQALHIYPDPRRVLGDLY